MLSLGIKLNEQPHLSETETQSLWGSSVDFLRFLSSLSVNQFKKKKLVALTLTEKYLRI